MKMDDAELLNILERRITAASESSLTAEQHKQAVDYYLTRPRGDELAGRSQVQSADVADMIEAILAQVLPAFAGDKVCAFEPDGPGDENQARLESDAVNKVMMEQARGYVVFYEAIKDALLLRNGIIKVWTEAEDWETTESYRTQNEDEVAYLGENGRVEPADEPGLYNVTRSGSRRKLRMQAIDPLNFYVDDETDCILLDDSRGTYERKVMTRGELVTMGFKQDQISAIPLYQSGTRVTDNVRRNQSLYVAPEQAGWAAELVEVWESYVRLDVNGDGVAEQLRCLTGQRVLLSQEPAEIFCYASGTAFIQPHRWQGISLFDKLKGVQDVKTATLRSFIDNIAAAGNSRIAVDAQTVNIDDAKTTRPGGIIRTKGPPGNSILPLPPIEAGQSAQALLVYMDKVRAERGGAALEMQSGEPGLMNSQIGAANVAEVLTSVELLSALIARTLGETLMRSAFLLVHRTLRAEATEPMSLLLADQWVQVDPRTWRERTALKPVAGVTPGERNRKAQALEKVVAHQSQLLQQGLDGVLVTLPNYYSAMLDWCSAQGMDAGRYFTDPAGQASTQHQAQKGQQQGQAQQMAQQMAQQQQQLEAGKLQLEKYKAELETAFKYWKGRLDAEVEEAKLIGAATAELQRIEAEGAQQQLGAERSGSGDGAQRAA